MSEVKKAGFVAVLGRPNAGKSTLLNHLVGERLALVSHKANATRKRMNFIILHKDSQIIFVDTPGLHNQEKLLNQFMLQEALKALGDCDLILFLAPITDSLSHYEDFLRLSDGKKHILLLTKVDTVSNDKLLQTLAKYAKYDNKFEALIPVSVNKRIGDEAILDEVVKHLPYSPALFDTEMMTTENMRQLYKEIIRESIFENISDEIPYESDVVIDNFKEERNLEKIEATIIIEKDSQKGVLIGKGGATLQRIGKDARTVMERLGGKKVFLKLFVKVQKGWSKDKKRLAEFGYEFE
ncbi:MAG: GTPase Era [Wolinella sp.]